MSRSYAVPGSMAFSANKAFLLLISATTVRPAINDIVLSTSSTPDDKQTKFALKRFTAWGAGGTAVTPRALDPADPTALASAKVGSLSTEPTYASDPELIQFAHNMRPPWRHFFYPGGEIILPATASYGVALEFISSGGTPTYEGTIFFRE